MADFLKAKIGERRYNLVLDIVREEAEPLKLVANPTAEL
jgi:hypothetical protein